MYRNEKLGFGPYLAKQSLRGLRGLKSQSARLMNERNSRQGSRHYFGLIHELTQSDVGESEAGLRGLGHTLGHRGRDILRPELMFDLMMTEVSSQVGVCIIGFYGFVEFRLAFKIW